MKCCYKIFAVLFLLASGIGLTAQDIHFSQFYNMPLHQNPALTGHIPGSYRAKVLYRNQWNTITGGGVYSTPAISFDMNFKPGNQESLNSLGAGIVVLNDQTGGGDFNNTLILASAAYHLALDKKGKSYMSFGVQGGYITKRVDQANLVFGNQFDGSGNATLASNENFTNNSVSGGDLRVGVAYSGYPSNKMNYKFGGSYMHIIGLNEEFISGGENKLPGRIAIFGQAEFLTGNPKLKVKPEVQFMNQAKVNEINLTTNLAYQLGADFGLLFGAGYRIGDAPLANAGFTFKGVELLATYDVNVSQLSPASRYQGGFEISLGYIGRIKKSVEPNLPCIRFY